MSTETYLIKKNSEGRLQYQKFVLDGSVLSREWGLIGGAIQTTSNAYGFTNEGKANELTPEQTAQADCLRIIEKKIKEGCVVVPDLDNLPDLDQNEVVYLNNIPTAFCCSKPTQTITEAALDKLIQSKNAKFFIKYNGLCHYILLDLQGEVQLFTRRWDNHTAKYPEIVQAMKKSGYPRGTLLITEFCIDPSLRIPHMQAFSLMSSISKADTLAGKCKDKLPKTIALQEKHRVKAAVYGMLYQGNKPVWNRPYGVMLKELQNITPGLADDKALFVPREVPIKSAAQAIDVVKKNKTVIEGFVVWDITQAMKVTMNGKPDRAASWKVKAKGEKDVIADGWLEGAGDLQGKVGSLCICQYDAQGNRIDLGSVGGLKPTEGECEIDYWKFPCVIEIEFDQIFPDTGKFQFGHFTKRHEDKLPADVELFSLA